MGRGPGNGLVVVRMAVRTTAGERRPGGELYRADENSVRLS